MQNQKLLSKSYVQNVSNKWYCTYSRQCKCWDYELVTLCWCFNNWLNCQKRLFSLSYWLSFQQKLEFSNLGRGGGKILLFMLILQTRSQFWFAWSQSLFKKAFLTITPFFLNFNLSFLLPHTHTHTHTTNTLIPYTLIPVGPPAVLLGGLTQPIIRRQPVGISLTAWQTVILNATRTHRKGGLGRGTVTALWFDTCVAEQ